jgi:hypothetical protein
MLSPLKMRCQAFISAVMGIVVVAGTAMADPTTRFPPEFMSQLQHSKEIYVATLRKDGTRSTAVPVWFGILDDAILFSSLPDNHKAKRVKRGSPIFVSVQGKDGPFIKTKAEIVKDGGVAERLGQIYSQKYWIAWVGMFRPSRAKIETGKNVLIRLTPEP